MKGVVDSEDLPLSLSREKPQDTALISKIGGVLTKKIIRFLQEMMRKEPEKYRKLFFTEFGSFLKEVRVALWLLTALLWGLLFGFYRRCFDLLRKSLRSTV